MYNMPLQLTERPQQYRQQLETLTTSHHCMHAGPNFAGLELAASLKGYPYPHLCPNDRCIKAGNFRSNPMMLTATASPFGNKVSTIALTACSKALQLALRLATSALER